MELVKLPNLFPKTGISCMRHHTPYKLSFLSCQVRFVIIYCVNWLHAVSWMQQQQKKECQSQIDQPKIPASNRKCNLTELVHFRFTSHPIHELQPSRNWWICPKMDKHCRAEEREHTNNEKRGRQQDWRKCKQKLSEEGNRMNCLPLPLQTNRILHHGLHLLYAN